MFLKACAVALLLAPALDWLDDESAPHDRQQLQQLLRHLTRVLLRGNEAGTRYETRCVGRIAHGLALLVQKNVGVAIEPELPAALLESVELGLAGLTSEEDLRALKALLRVCAAQGRPGEGALRRFGSDVGMSNKVE